MRIVANVRCGRVVVAHLGFMILEMFFWGHPVGRRIFSMAPEVSASSAVLAVGAAGGMCSKSAIYGTATRCVPSFSRGIH